MTETFPYIIRQATKKDIPQILMIKKLADISNIQRGVSVLNLGKILYSDYLESKKYFENKIDQILSFVIEYNNAIIGCGFLVDLSEGYDIQTVYIEPSFQGQGVGRKLIEYFIDVARQKGKEFLELETATAEGFYKKLGFAEISNTFKMIKYL